MSRHGLEVETKAVEAGVRGEDNGRRAGRTPAMFAVPLVKVVEPIAQIGVEARICLTDAPRCRRRPRRSESRRRRMKGRAPSSTWAAKESLPMSDSACLR